MGVRSGLSQVNNLAFSVFDRAVHPDWFTVRNFRRLTRTGWEADLRIIDGGHAITFVFGSTQVTEILCGLETSLPERGILFQTPMRREKTAQLRPCPQVEYQTCMEVERLDPRVFARLTEELVLDPTPGDLFHSFATASRMAPEAVSRIHLDARGKGLSVQGYHTFPGESAIVRTQSLFEIVG